MKTSSAKPIIGIIGAGCLGIVLARQALAAGYTRFSINDPEDLL